MRISNIIGVSMDEDISKNTLLVLVVLTILISLLGTWTVINETAKARAYAPTATGEASAQGRVSMTVKPVPEAVMTTGHVTVTIINPDDQPR